MSALETPYVVQVARGPVDYGDPPGTPLSWYDASDITTFTFSGSAITAWADKMAANNATAVGTPVLAEMPNDSERQAVMLNGTQSFTCGVSASDNTQSAFMVVLIGSIAANNPLLGPSAAGGRAFRMTTIPDIRITRQNVGEFGAQSPGPSIGVPTVVGYVMTATDVTYYTNLTSETDAATVTFTGSLTTRIGSAAGTGADTTPARALFGEVVVYDTSLSAGDATDVVDYLMLKWAIS